MFSHKTDQTVNPGKFHINKRQVETNIEKPHVSITYGSIGVAGINISILRLWWPFWMTYIHVLKMNKSHMVL